ILNENVFGHEPKRKPVSNRHMILVSRTRRVDLYPTTTRRAWRTQNRPLVNVDLGGNGTTEGSAMNAILRIRALHHDERLADIELKLHSRKCNAILARVDVEHVKVDNVCPANIHADAEPIELAGI